MEAGIISPNHIPVSELQAGDVGYITASIKDIRSCRVGDTVTLAENPTETPMPGYKKVTPMVYWWSIPCRGRKVRKT